MADWKATRRILGRSSTKYRFYFGDYSYVDPTKSKVGSTLPKPHLGWGSRAVDIRANKTHFDKFENDTLGFNDLITKYHVREAFEKLKGDILVCGVGFLALANDKVMPFTAEEATGVYDWNTQNLKSGVAIYQNNTDRLNKTDIPDSYIEYNADSTIISSKNDGDTAEANQSGRPLMGLLTHGATTKQPFGRSVLNRPAREAIVDASRTVRQANVAAYHYNIKVDLILGADSSTAVDTVEASVGDILKVGTNENGQIPQIAEFAQHVMNPFTDTVMIAARNFCADTKLNLANLGMDTNAPQSTEALEIVGDDLKDDILAWQQELGGQLKYFLMTLYMHDNDISEIDENLQKKFNDEKLIWRPIYEADVSKFGDGLTKIAQQAPQITKARSIWRSLGLTSDEIDTIVASQE